MPVPRATVPAMSRITVLSLGLPVNNRLKDDATESADIIPKASSNAPLRRRMVPNVVVNMVRPLVSWTHTRENTNRAKI